MYTSSNKIQFQQLKKKPRASRSIFFGGDRCRNVRMVVTNLPQNYKVENLKHLVTNNFISLMLYNAQIEVQRTVSTLPVIAITSISTLAFNGSFATCTHERAGKSCAKTERNRLRVTLFRRPQTLKRLFIATNYNYIPESCRFIPFLYS